MSAATTPSRRVSVPAARLPGWVERFAARHGDPMLEPHPEGWLLLSPDGAEAVLTDRWAARPDTIDLDQALTHLTRDRRLGLVLARKSAHAVGVAEGPRLVIHRVDTHYVQGRTKAGGWSQQRYARRRDNQASKAGQSAASDVAHRLLPELESLDAVVCGGDRRFVDEVFDDPRLVPLQALRTAEVLATPDPRLAVLEAFVEQARAITVLLNDLA